MLLQTGELLQSMHTGSLAHEAQLNQHGQHTLILRWSGYWYFQRDNVPSPLPVIVTSLFCGSGCAPHTVLPALLPVLTRCVMPA
jgi:hypothetical protein